MQDNIKKYDATWPCFVDIFELTFQLIFYLKKESILSNMSTIACELKLRHGFSDVTVPTIDVQTPSICLFIFVP